MLSVKNLGGETTYNTEGLASHCQVFLERLCAQGYAPYTVRFYKLTIRRFLKEIERRGLCVRDLEGPANEVLQEAVLSETTHGARTFALFCLKRFIDHLNGAGVVALPEPQTKELTALDRLREEYYTYLCRQRGLSESTIYHCIRYMERFLSFRFGEKLGDLNAITSDDVANFICQLKTGSRPLREKALPSQLRNLFKFLFWSGKIKRNLANGIPRVAYPQPGNLPRYLKQEDIRRLIEAVQTNDAIGRRNYAMMLLVARLGLRAPEVTAIQLEDIDWRSGEILIRGKGKRHDKMPLPADIGEAIVDYIRNGRTGDSRTLFVSSITPHLPFKDGQIMNYILRAAFKKTGLKQPQRFVGSHLLRHSLATDMLRKGASLDEIGDVLRHRSRMTTMIYAKYDIDALRSIIRPWAVQGGADDIANR